MWITTPDHHKIISKVSHFCLFCKIGGEAYGALQNEGWICCTPSSNSRLSLHPLSTKPSRAQIWETSTSTQKFKKGYHIIYCISKDVRDFLQVFGFDTEGHMFQVPVFPSESYWYRHKISGMHRYIQCSVQEGAFGSYPFVSTICKLCGSIYVNLYGQNLSKLDLSFEYTALGQEKGHDMLWWLLHVWVDVITLWNLDCQFVWSFSILYVQRMATEAIEGMAPEEISESAICGGSATTSHRCKPVPIMRVSTSTRHRDLEPSGSPGSPLRSQISHRRQLRKKEAEC